MLMNQMKTTTDLDKPWMTSWNKENMESVDACPVCNGQQRKILHNGLIDNVFRVAPGHWDLYECLNCVSAYLDPRPTLESIGRALKLMQGLSPYSIEPRTLPLGLSLRTRFPFRSVSDLEYITLLARKESS